MSWKTESVGRVLINMPTERPRSWSSEFDGAIVRRLQRPLSLSQFWAGVETVRDQYVRQLHDMHPTRLGHYVRLDAPKAALVMGYQSDASFFAPLMWRFVHLGDQHAYEFKQTLSTGNKPPSPELFKPYVDKATPVLSRIQPLKDGEIPSGEGLSIEGAVVSGETGRNAKASLISQIATGSYLGVSYRENLYRAAIESGFEELQREQDRAQTLLSFTKEPEGFKEFKVLRRQERVLAGLLGQEFITRTTFNNGHVVYAMHWGVKGSPENLLTPRITVHLNTHKNLTTPAGEAYVPLPPEPELIRLWDSVLASFKLRPGALSPGQVLRAVN